MARCLSCSFGEAREGDTSCDRCRAKRRPVTPQRSSSELATDRLANLRASEAVFAAKQPSFALDKVLAGVREQIAEVEQALDEMGAHQMELERMEQR